MDHTAARAEMVATQLRARHIRDEAVIAAISTVPRHLFIPETNRDLAYRDGPVAIGEGQTISQPYLVALMTEALQLSAGMRVLEVGTGSGYQAAILSALGVQVHSLELRPRLQARATQTLNALGAGDVQTHLGDGFDGLCAFAPFDRIIVTAAPNAIPHALRAQLSAQGQMIIPVGARKKQILMRVYNHERRLPDEPLIPVLFVPMTAG